MSSPLNQAVLWSEQFSRQHDIKHMWNGHRASPAPRVRRLSQEPVRTGNGGAAGGQPSSSWSAPAGAGQGSTCCRRTERSPAAAEPPRAELGTLESEPRGPGRWRRRWGHFLCWLAEAWPAKQAACQNRGTNRLWATWRRGRPLPGAAIGEAKCLWGKGEAAAVPKGST